MSAKVSCPFTIQVRRRHSLPSPESGNTLNHIARSLSVTGNGDEQSDSTMYLKGCYAKDQVVTQVNAVVAS